MRIGGVENLSFFESTILFFVLQNKTLLHSHKNQSKFIYRIGKMGSNFDDYDNYKQNPCYA